MTQALQQTLRAYADRLWNQHDLGAIEAYSAPGGVVHEFPGASQLVDIATITSRVERILQLMPDHVMRFGHMLSSDDAVFWSWRITGTWRVEGGDARPVDVAGASLYWFADGRIIRRSGEADALRLDHQTGRIKRDVRMLFPM